MKKRLLSILLTACLLMGLLPTAALAAEVQNVDGDGNLTRAGLSVMICGNATLSASLQNMADSNVSLNFSDVEDCSTEQLAAITLLVQAGVIQGSASDTAEQTPFNPGDPAPRGMAALLIYRALGVGSDAAAETQTIFSDIPDSFAPAINYLVAAGILTEADVRSTDDTGKCFEPYAPATPAEVEKWLGRIPKGAVTRAQLAEMIYANNRLKGIIDLAAWGDTNELHFSDIDSCTDKQKTAIYAMTGARVLSGNSDGTFAPNVTVTRAQAAVVLWRAMGCLSNKETAEPPYSDVHPSQWYAAAINCLFALGILTEDDAAEGGSFRLDDPVKAEELTAWLDAYDSLETDTINSLTTPNGLSRAEMAVIFYNEYKAMLPDPAGYTTDFSDISSCTDEQKAAIALFNNLELPNGGGPIISGLGGQYVGTFAPFAAASNAQTAALLYRLITWIESQEEIAEESRPVESSLEDEIVLRSAMVRNAAANSWYSDALDFFAARGLEDAVTTVNENPDAPAVKENLQTWSKALKPDAPIFSLTPGTYPSAQSVTLTAEEDAVIHYTTDGSEPTADSTVYSSAVTVSSSMTIKAVAVKNGLISDVASAAYTISTGTGGGSSDSGSSGGGSFGGGSSSSSSTTTKNPDGSTTTTVTDKTTGTVTETTKNTDGSTTTVETKKDGTVTETIKTTNGTTGTTVTDKDGNVTEVKASVSTAAANEAAKTGGAVPLPVEVPAASSTKDAPAVEITLSKSTSSVKVGIPVEQATPGTVAVIVKADGTEEIVSTSMVTENGVTLTLNGSTTLKVFDNAKSFTDVSASNVFYSEVCSLSAREIMVGKTGEKFDLYSSVTLNQLSNVAARITGAVDVKDYSGGIAWGQANGLKTGNVSATRGDVLSALYVAADSPAVEDTSILSKLNDANDIPDDMKTVTAWALQNDILKGTADGKADLSANVTRGQACALAGRTLKTLG